MLKQCIKLNVKILNRSIEIGKVINLLTFSVDFR